MSRQDGVWGADVLAGASKRVIRTLEVCIRFRIHKTTARSRIQCTSGGVGRFLAGFRPSSAGTRIRSFTIHTVSLDTITTRNSLFPLLAQLLSNSQEQCSVLLLPMRVLL